MPRAGSEIYLPNESPNSKTSTGTANTQTFTPAKRAVGVWISVETTSARVTFDSTTPGNGTGPGLVIPAGASPQFYPFPFQAGTNNIITFVSASAGNSLMSVVFMI